MMNIVSDWFSRRSLSVSLFFLQALAARPEVRGRGSECVSGLCGLFQLVLTTMASRLLFRLNRCNYL